MGLADQGDGRSHGKVESKDVKLNAAAEDSDTATTSFSEGDHAMDLCESKAGERPHPAEPLQRAGV